MYATGLDKTAYFISTMLFVPFKHFRRQNYVFDLKMLVFVKHSNYCRFDPTNRHFRIYDTISLCVAGTTSDKYSHAQTPNIHWPFTHSTTHNSDETC